MSSSFLISDSLSYKVAFTLSPWMKSLRVTFKTEAIKQHFVAWYGTCFPIFMQAKFSEVFHIYVAVFLRAVTATCSQNFKNSLTIYKTIDLTNGR